MPIERDGRTYLTTYEAQAAVNHPHSWLSAHVKAGNLQQHHLTPDRKIWYDRERVLALKKKETQAIQEKHATEPPRDVSRFMTVAQVAKALGFNRSYIDKLIKQGKLPAINIGGDSRSTDIRVKVEDYEHFVAQNYVVERELVKQREKAGA